MKSTHGVLKAMVLFGMCVIVGCDRTSTRPDAVAAPTPAADLVEELARDPVKLKELRRLCREEREQVADELCVASALAARQRFMGSGRTRYTPESVALPAGALPEPKRE